MTMAQSGGEWLLMVDGAARGNPGPAGCGAYIRDAEGVVRKKLCRYLGIATNNVAEYEGLLMGLAAALELGSKIIRIESDSELMVNQLNGVYGVRDDKLKRLYERALGLLQQFDRYRIIHIGREQNQIADQLANQGVEYGLEHHQGGKKPKGPKAHALP
jgi:ribonuclease HI